MNNKCEWTNGEDGPCESDCGYEFIFTDDGPEENGFKFCPKCGCEIVVTKTEVEP